MEKMEKTAIDKRQEQLENIVIEERYKDIPKGNIRLSGLGILFVVLFTIPLLISGFWSFLSIGFTGENPFILILIELFSLAHIALGIYFMSNKNVGVNKNGSSIALSAIVLLGGFLTFHGIFIVGKDDFMLMIPLLVLSIIGLIVVFLTGGPKK